MKLSYYILFALLLISLSSCVKELDYDDLDFEKEIVLNGLIYQDSIIKVHVARTKSIIDMDSILPFLENAEVKLYENGVFIENLKHDSLGSYSSSIKTKANSSYLLEARTNEIGSASASFSFKEIKKFRLSNIEYQVHDTILSIDKPVKTDTSLMWVSLNFDMIFLDEAETEDYYDFIAFGTFNPCVHRREYFSDTEYIEYLTLSESKTFRLSFSNHNDSEKYSPGHGSSYNGYEQNFYMSDEMFNGDEVTFSLRASYYTTKIEPIEITLYCFPYDYIFFHTSGYRYIRAADNPFSQPINIYSNVENGLGIVCAVTTSKWKILP
jgi:hypothetical protein